MSFFKTLLFLDAHQKSEDKTEIIESQTREIGNSNNEILRLKNELEKTKRQLADANLNQVPQWKVTEMYKQQARNEELERDREYYSSLLSKPMLEIAERNRDFKRTYEKQLAILAKQAIENMAIKELAQLYGVALGKSDEEFERELDDARGAVESGNSQFNNNVAPERLKEVARLEEIEEEEKERQRLIEGQIKKGKEKAMEWERKTIRDRLIREAKERGEVFMDSDLDSKVEIEMGVEIK